MKRSVFFATFALSFVSSPAQVLWDESVEGPISNSAEATQIGSLIAGSNRVVGSATPAGAGGQDIFSFDVPAGLALAELVVDRFTVTGGTTGGAGAFFAVERGTSLTATDSADALLGTAFFGPTDVGIDVLQNLGQAPLGGAGFSGPLAAGPYTFWVRENSGTFDYTLDFQTVAIPEPGPAPFLAITLLGCFLRRRGRR